MRKTVRGGGNGNGRTWKEWEWQNTEWECALRGGENEKDSVGRGEWEWQNTEWQPTPYRLNKYVVEIIM
jgi:hypothetical protein